MYDVSCGNPWTDTTQVVLCDMMDMTFGARRPASISALVVYPLTNQLYL